MQSPSFCLRHESSGQAVDWEAVDDELDKIPAELKDPRFDSLRHVLNILSAVDAEAALEEVTSQQKREPIRLHPDCSNVSHLRLAASRAKRYNRMAC